MADRITDERLAKLGGNPMFATHESMQEALDYIIDLGKATDSPAAVTTAAYVFLNTYIAQRELTDRARDSDRKGE